MRDPIMLADAETANSTPANIAAVSDAVRFKNEIAATIISPELWIRQAHPADVVAEVAALRRLAESVEADPAGIFQVCVEVTLDLCRADTCGISFAERTPAGDEVFRWIALAGRLHQHLRGTTPRHFSPCGVTVDGSTPVLMRRPELVYKYLDVGVPFHDVLLIPLTDKRGDLEGTIWIVAHTPERKFDREDARTMQHVAGFTTTALRLAKETNQAKGEVRRLEGSMAAMAGAQRMPKIRVGAAEILRVINRRIQADPNLDCHSYRIDTLFHSDRSVDINWDVDYPTIDQAKCIGVVTRIVLEAQDRFELLQSADETAPAARS